MATIEELFSERKRLLQTEGLYHNLREAVCRLLCVDSLNTTDAEIEDILDRMSGAKHNDDQR